MNDSSTSEVPLSKTVKPLRCRQQRLFLHWAAAGVNVCNVHVNVRQGVAGTEQLPSAKRPWINTGLKAGGTQPSAELCQRRAVLQLAKLQPPQRFMFVYCLSSGFDLLTKKHASAICLVAQNKTKQNNNHLIAEIPDPDHQQKLIDGSAHRMSAKSKKSQTG